MATIEKKILPEFFEAIQNGKKKFELRLNEFECKEGDMLRLREWDKASGSYTGREVSKKVTYSRVFKLDELYWPLEEIKEKGLLLISLE